MLNMSDVCGHFLQNFPTLNVIYEPLDSALKNKYCKKGSWESILIMSSLVETYRGSC